MAFCVSEQRFEYNFALKERLSVIGFIIVKVVHPIGIRGQPREMRFSVMQTVK